MIASLLTKSKSLMHYHPRWFTAHLLWHLSFSSGIIPFLILNPNSCRGMWLSTLNLGREKALRYFSDFQFGLSFEAFVVISTALLGFRVDWWAKNVRVHCVTKVPRSVSKESIIWISPQGCGNIEFAESYLIWITPNSIYSMLDMSIINKNLAQPSLEAKLFTH